MVHRNADRHYVLDRVSSTSDCAHIHSEGAFLQKSDCPGETPSLLQWSGATVCSWVPFLVRWIYVLAEDAVCQELAPQSSEQGGFAPYALPGIFDSCQRSARNVVSDEKLLMMAIPDHHRMFQEAISTFDNSFSSVCDLGLWTIIDTCSMG